MNWIDPLGTGWATAFDQWLGENPWFNKAVEKAFDWATDKVDPWGGLGGDFGKIITTLFPPNIKIPEPKNPSPAKSDPPPPVFAPPPVKPEPVPPDPCKKQKTRPPASVPDPMPNSLPSPIHGPIEPSPWTVDVWLGNQTASSFFPCTVVACVATGRADNDPTGALTACNKRPLLRR